MTPLARNFTCPKCGTESTADTPYIEIEKIRFCVRHAMATTLFGFAAWRDQGINSAFMTEAYREAMLYLPQLPAPNVPDDGGHCA